MLVTDSQIFPELARSTSYTAPVYLLVRLGCALFIQVIIHVMALGLEYTDTVHLANISIANQGFGGSFFSNGFGFSGGPDGILG